MQSLSASWQLEWRRAVRRRRLFALNMIIPLLLVVPIALGGAPPAHAAAVYAVLFALFGTFGAAIPALRDAEHGLIRRVGLTRLDMRGVVMGRALAGSCIDAVQLLPSLIVILATGHATLSMSGTLAVTLLVALVFANLFGLIVAAVARSVGEGALFASITTLLLLHASGVFRTPAPGSLGALIEMVSPYRGLHELLVTATHGTPASGSSIPYALILAAVICTVSAKLMVRSLARADGQG